MLGHLLLLCRTKILRTADAFSAWRREGPYRFIQNRPRTFLAALKSYGAAEKSKDQLLRDFWGCSIFAGAEVNLIRIAVGLGLCKSNLANDHAKELED
jgi:hypothetical protein